MIKSTILENFQSHTFSELEFHEGVNVITGPSDCGKSAIIRAFYWVFNNRPSGESFKNWKSKKSDQTAVEITTDENKITITRNNSKTAYIINEGKPLEAMKMDVPSEVTKAIDIAEYNLQTQFDPYFLLQSTSGEIARKLNEYANIEIIDILFQNIDAEVRKTNELISHYKSNKNQIESSLEEYKNLDDIKNIIDSISENYEKSVGIESSRNFLQKHIESLESIELERSELKSIIEVEQRVNPLIDSMEEIKIIENNVKTLSSMIQSLEDIETEINSNQDFLDLEKRVKSIFEMIKNCENIHNTMDELSRMISSLNNIETHFDVEKLKKEKAVNEYLDYLSKEKKCPTCSSTLNKNILNNIKENL